jgi:hypothetical protein
MGFPALPRFAAAAAQYNLAQSYNSGEGIAKDAAEAVHWWQKAAEQGNAKAQYNVGLAYSSGVGVPKNDVEAYFWINIAASSLEQGFVRESRDRIGKSLTPTQLFEGQERGRKWGEAHPNTQCSP